jgi:lysophospholipase L1-like esterase
MVRKAVLLGAFGIPFAGSLEVATRLDQWIRYGAPLIGSYTYESALYEEDSLGIRGKPHGRFEKWELNGVGLRGPEIETPKPHGLTRIAAVGSSETFGLFESPGNEWPRQLERDLHRSLPNTEVNNASIAGMGLRRRIEFFEKRIVQLQPDVALLMLEYSSYVGVVLSAERDAVRSVTQVAPARAALGLGFTPRIVRKAKDAVIPRLPEPFRNAVQEFLIESRVSSAREDLGDDFGRYREVRPAHVHEFEKDVIRFLGFTREHEIDAVILLPALRVDEATLRDYRANYPYINESWIREAIDAFPTIARRLAAQHDVQVIDLAPAVAGRERELMMDMFHFNDEGARLVAAAMAADLRF